MIGFATGLARPIRAWWETLRPPPDLKPRPTKVYPLCRMPDGRKARVTSRFKTRNRSRPTHNGDDWFWRWRRSDPDWERGDGGGTWNRRWICPPGSYARATDAGVIRQAGNSRTGYRLWLYLPGGKRCGYFHLRALFVGNGDRVVAGQPLGPIGDNPVDNDAAHLHFEVSPDVRYQPYDPTIYYRGAAHLDARTAAAIDEECGVMPGAAAAPV